MNTVDDDTGWVEGCQTQFFHKKNFDFYADPKSALNCIFEEVCCEACNEQSKTFTSFEAFINWIVNGPMQGVLTSTVEHAEEVYACYFKEYPGQTPNVKAVNKLCVFCICLNKRIPCFCVLYFLKSDNPIFIKGEGKEDMFRTPNTAP